MSRRRRRLDTFTGELPKDKARRVIQESLARRESAYAALTRPDGWSAMIVARILHPRYSWRNCALIADQCPTALAVATFAQWKAQGYHVREREHACAVVTVRKGGKFSSASVFDVTQTDAPPFEDPADVYPEGFAAMRDALSRAVTPPATLDDVPRAGEGLQLAYERLTRSQEV